MTGTAYLDGRVTVHAGDCADVLKTLPDNSVDACVTDPPYHLTSIVKRFGSEKAAPAQYGTNGAYARASAGFMGQRWDGGDIAFRPELWAEVLRVLKPGGHMLAFGGTRTYHRLACAIEDAGFEIRDQIMWVYGSGFPKSHDVSKGIDKAAGAEREFVGVRKFADGTSARKTAGVSHKVYGDFAGAPIVTAPSTEAARQWQGWGTALKPAVEPIVLARKPLSEGTVAANVLKHGTGAINVDGCRVETEETIASHYNTGGSAGHTSGVWREKYKPGDAGKYIQTQGRWPANLIHDGSDEVVAAFPETGISSGGMKPGFSTKEGWTRPSHADWQPSASQGGFGDSGSAARFFYTAKADSDDRLGAKHPTVKPLDLIQYLVRLICPRGGLVLDPFAGTGTTAEAAIREGCKAVLIEREPEYLADIERRCSLILAGPDTRLHATIKAKNRPEEPLPLFAEVRPQ